MISVGNLQLGGSGKTPLVAAIAAHLDAGGRRVAVLSRGYGRTTRGPRLASRGNGPEASAAEVGDEPRLLAQALPRVAVVVGEDRYVAGLHAIDALGAPPDVFVLDDGFSHLGLARDLDLLAFPLDRPWGNGRLLPFGSLREPLDAARVAQAVILTGMTGQLDGAARPLRVALAPFGFAGPAFAAGLERDHRASSHVFAACRARHRHRASRACGAHRARARARGARAPGVRRSSSVPAAQSRPYRACPASGPAPIRWWSPPRIE